MHTRIRAIRRGHQICVLVWTGEPSIQLIQNGQLLMTHEEWLHFKSLLNRHPQLLDIIEELTKELNSILNLECPSCECDDAINPDNHDSDCPFGNVTSLLIAARAFTADPLTPPLSIEDDT